MAATITYKQTILVNRIAKGDWEAVEELWPTLFDTPFDENRPLQDIVNDLTDKIKSITPVDEKPKVTTGTEDVVGQVGQIWKSILDELAKADTTAKRRQRSL